MKTSWSCSVLFLCFYTALPAQQLPLFSVYRDQWCILNPAALSNNYLINDRTMTLSATYHLQWWNLPTSPQTQLINWEAVNDDYHIIYGANLINDQAGKLSQTGLFGRFGYHIDLGRRIRQAVVIGLNAGLVQYRAKLSKIAFPDPNTSPGADAHLFYPDFALGIFYYYNDRYYTGFSIPQVLGLTTRFESGDQAFAVRRVQHFNLVVGGYYDLTWLGNGVSYIEPSIWVKYAPNGPLNLDLNARVQISELIWTGLGINAGFGLEPRATLHFESGLFFGDQVNMLNSQLKFGFGFDLALSQDIRVNYGNSAELNVVYSWH